MKVVEWACLLLRGGVSVLDPTPAKAWGTAPPGQRLLPPALALVPSGWVSGEHSRSLVLAVGCCKKGQLHQMPVGRRARPLHLTPCPSEGSLGPGDLAVPGMERGS